MKRQYRLYSNVAILCAAAAASFWLLLPDAAARCASGGEKAGVSREECLSVRPGDKLDKAWFVLGEPQQSEAGCFLWLKPAAKNPPHSCEKSQFYLLHSVQHHFNSRQTKAGIFVSGKNQQ